MVKYSNLLADWLVDLGYSHCFFVAGGGIMHLLDGFRDRFECIPVVHEMSAGICAEHFNQCRSDGQKAFALVTTGPGLTNIVTAIAGCYVEHRELLVIAGQVKSTDLLKAPERQRGVQEVDGASICRAITIRSECIRSPIPRSEFQNLVRLAQGPHPGPIMVEICLDIQGVDVDPGILNHANEKAIETEILPKASDIAAIRDLIRDSKRPLFLLGGLVSRDIVKGLLPQFEELGIPVATTTSAIDRVPTDFSLFAGRPGTWGGQRAGNLILAQCDVLLAIGAQLDLQQTGFNYDEYAPNAKIIHVFPSQVELARAGPSAEKKILASADQFLIEMLQVAKWSDTDRWNDYVQNIRALVPPLEASNRSGPDYVNSFSFFKELSRASRASDILAVCSSGGTFTGALQNYEIKAGQIATLSPAHASMGYGLATAIGAAFANPFRRIVLVEGEGGFSQSLQELAVIQRFALQMKIFIIDNNGYASIRATQKKFFNGAYLGCDPETGLGFPNWIKLFDAYDIPCRYLTKDDANQPDLERILDQQSGPEAFIVRVDPEQTNWPTVSTKLHKNGALTSSALYDMIPSLPDDIQSRVTVYI